MCIDLASKVFCIAMINHLLLYGNWDISNCLLHFISTKLKYHICVFKNMGVVAPRAPLVKIFRNLHWMFVKYVEGSIGNELTEAL